MLPLVRPHAEALLVASFRNALERIRRVRLNRLYVVGPVPYEWNFQFWEQPKIVSTVRWLVCFAKNAGTLT